MLGLRSRVSNHVRPPKLGIALRKYHWQYPAFSWRNVKSSETFRPIARKQIYWMEYKEKLGADRRRLRHVCI